MAKKTDYGKELLHQSWVAYEFTSLETLFNAGADVPRPYTMAHNAILMRFIGDEDGCAPTLNEISLDRQEARSLFARILYNLDVLLANGIVHGDLSAYNILYWEGNITLIDFPQVVAPKININAYSIFKRDVTRICEYFSKQGVKANGSKMASELWSSHGFPMKVEVDVRLLDEEDPGELDLWMTQQ